MKLTTFSDYTLRVLMFLAIDRSRLATIPEIAAAYGISENHLMKVVHQLARSGVIESVRGKGGGIRLAREPGDIRIGEIVRASEGQGPIVECMPAAETSQGAGAANGAADAAEATGDLHAACRIAPVCRLTKVLVEAFGALYATLDNYTLADLVDEPQKLGGILIRKQT